jgi:hypothetical protein
MIWYKIILLHYCGWLLFFFTGFFVGLMDATADEVSDVFSYYFIGSLFTAIFTITIHWCLI